MAQCVVCGKKGWFLKLSPDGRCKSCENVSEQKTSKPPSVQAIPKPTCPYCKTELAGRKPPKRRSTFTCRACSQKICVDPDQYIYATPYLTEEQSGYVGFISQLDHWIFTRGSRDDYEQMRAALSKKLGAEPRVGEVIWGLMNLSCRQCAEEHSKQVKAMAEAFSPDDHVVRQTASCHPQLDDIRSLMDDFRQFETDMGEARTEKPKGGRGGE